MFQNDTDNQIDGNLSPSTKGEIQPNLLNYKRFTLILSLLIVSIVLAVVQWGLHETKEIGEKKIAEWTEIPTGFEDESFEVPEDTVTYRLSDDSDILIYVTYTKFNPKTGQTYVGKSQGYGEPNAIVRGRDKYHHRNAEGFLPAVLDKYSIEKPAIRGREQQMIDYYGGAWSDRKVDGKPTLSANKIRAVAKKHKLGRYYHKYATREFTEIAKYTGF